MKKKELLQMKPLRVTAQMRKKVREDTKRDAGYDWRDSFGQKHHINAMQYQYYLFYRAVVENDILKVSVFTRKWILAGKNEPQYEIFISKKENTWLVYETKEEKWRTAKVDMLEYDTEKCRCLYTTDHYQTDSTRKLVNEYLGTGKREVEAAVLDFQSEVRKEELKNKHKSEITQIDEVMREVPELPRDFEKWVEKYGFIKKEYMFYKKDKKGKILRYCSHCRKWVRETTAEVKHNQETICPRCKTEVVYKSWGRQKYMGDETTVGILQKMNDDTGYILRKFDCKRKMNREKGWEEEPEITMHEYVRVRLDKRFAEVELFEYGEYKYTGVDRWCHYCRRSQWGYYTRSFGRAVMYTRNMQKVLETERFGRMNFKEVFCGDTGEKTSPAYILQRLAQYPELEYLQKSGLQLLSDEIMGATEEQNLFDKNAMTLAGFLKIDKQRVQRLKKINGGCSVLKALQYEQQSNEKLTDKQLWYIKACRVDVGELQTERTHLKLGKALNFLERQQEKEKQNYATIRRYYCDYLDMAEERGMDLTDEIVCKNNRMMEFHNKYLEEKNKKENEKRDKEVNEKFSKISEQYKENKKRFEWETESLCVIVPQRASDITKEGRLQHHCVGASDTYMRRMNEGTTYILFLRKKENMQQPYYTLEVNCAGTILQAYAAYDRKPDWEEVESVLKEYTKELEQRRKKEKKLKNAAQEIATQTLAYAG